MNGPLDSDNQDRSLWRQYADQAGSDLPELPPLDPNLLAAYLNGSAEPQDVELVEARMASDTAFVDQVMALRQMADLEATPAPRSLLSRARALAHRHTWLPRMQWAAAAAALLLACFIGYRVGDSTYHTRRDAQLFGSLQATLEIDELISDPAIGIIMPINGQNGNGR